MHSKSTFISWFWVLLILSLKYTMKILSWSTEHQQLLTITHIFHYIVYNFGVCISSFTLFCPVLLHTWRPRLCCCLVPFVWVLLLRECLEMKTVRICLAIRCKRKQPCHRWCTNTFCPNTNVDLVIFNEKRHFLKLL